MSTTSILLSQGASSDAGRATAASRREDVRSQRAVTAGAAEDERSAQQPFSRLMAEQPESGQERAVPPRGAAAGGTTETDAVETAPTASDTTLHQALAGLVDTLGSGLLTGDAHGNKGTPVAAEGSDGADDLTSPDASTEAQPLLLLLMPTLLPAATPPSLPTPAVAAFAALSGVVGDGAPASDAPSATAAPALSGAVAADAAQLLSVKSQSAADTTTDTALASGVTLNNGGGTDGSTWAGLQRWSAAIADSSSTGLTPSAAPSAGVTTEPTLHLPTQGQDWQNPLMQALGDRLQLQILQRSEQARLHLMPPHLGRIEIDIRQQGGALQVQLSATHDDVRQQLRQMAEPLRQDLVQRHSCDVSVQVASGAQASGDGRGRDGAAGGQQPQGQGTHGGQRDAQRQPGRAWTDDAALSGDGFDETLARQVQA
ncbi:flagellar hook-length control protein FliK [Roseateles sp. SL47]|uniref:flagellar hook-length control protein FliK n=1 Tax=Roseateles sp. SL47 TaxID=2995138 RepID=UPI00226D44A8|nr:flagellar hook-length control protein FliK [Roseateles sp. SL47]WAC75542.1 flagellar hook-length control protein FliK [Roseateles sp. SL47]